MSSSRAPLPLRTNENPSQERDTWSVDEFIEAIPYDETRNYSKRVLSSHFVYSWLDGGRVPPLPLK